MEYSFEYLSRMAITDLVFDSATVREVSALTGKTPEDLARASGCYRRAQNLRFVHDGVRQVMDPRAAAALHRYLRAEHPGLFDSEASA